MKTKQSWLHRGYFNIKTKRGLYNSVYDFFTFFSLLVNDCNLYLIK